MLDRKTSAPLKRLRKEEQVDESAETPISNTAIKAGRNRDLINIKMVE